MVKLYIQLVIAGSRTIASIGEDDIVAVAVGVLEKGYDRNKEYATLDDVPEEYKEEVVAQLIADGYMEE